ncbi:thiamine phosphate synthase [Clostridium thermobutyricum]|uniref:thiamine phosphate synthase n=1 Tax=Clostridium thermobutyricum TaxID=29372 RepID=UPI003F523D40
MKMDRLKFYLVTDSDILRERDFYKSVEEALSGGVTCVQLREKNLLGKEFLIKAKKIRELTRKYNALFIVNDRIDIAMLSDADGVHVGQADLDILDVRKLIGSEKIVGVSASNIEEAILAEKNGADYIGVGSIFPTNTKKDAKNVYLNGLKEIKNNINIPIVAIGGIKEDNIKLIKDIGVNGYAIVSDILSAKNIKEKCENINLIIK